ncbi:hypothetical protein ACFLZX_03085 [Nanoarchaeota archaeon]
MALIESFSGVRGIFEKDLKKNIIQNYAASFCLNKKKIVVGRDTRKSSIKIKDVIVNSVGINVIDVGVASTPEIELAVRKYKADGGIIITASHNEPHFNGMKFLGRDGMIISPERMNKLIWASRIKKDVKKGKVVRKDISKEYVSFIKKVVGSSGISKITKGKFHVVVDPNGGTGIIAKKVLESIGVKVSIINGKIGEFKRTIEPKESSLSWLKKEVKEKKADFGAGFDCDGDRAELVIDDRFVSGHYVLALLVSAALKKEGVVVVNDATSHLLKEVVDKLGGSVVDVEVGEVNVVEEMVRLNSIVGGEGSCGGGIVKPSRCRDGTLTIVMILKLMAEKKKKLKDILEVMPKYFTIQNKVKVDGFDKKKFELMVKERYRKNKIIGCGSSIKVLFRDGFLWFRESKTESDTVRIIVDSNAEDVTQSTS